jgi:3-hydroxybutyryl-CoA dehydratase
MADLWTPGRELPRLQRTMTAERMRWYSDALELVTLAADEPVHAEPNIHTDDAIARANGLRGRVADGMISTNWISTLLSDEFGHHYLEGGSLRTRYVRPIFEDDRIEVVIRITGRKPADDGRELLVADVSCVKSDGEVATAGEATISVETGEGESEQGGP